METSIAPLLPNPAVKRQWTEDPMQNVLLLPEEVIDEILFELAQCEIDNIRRVPTGTFTWFPHLIGDDTEFCRRYTMIFALCLKAHIALHRQCDWIDESLDDIPLLPEYVVGFLQTFAFYGPREALGVTGCIDHGPTHQSCWHQKFGECRNAKARKTCIDYCRCAGPRRLENTLYFRGGAGVTTWDISPADLPMPRGLTHLWMFEGTGGGPVADLKDWNVCPCCATPDGARKWPVMLAPTVTRGDLRQARQLISAHRASTKLRASDNKAKE